MSKGFYAKWVLILAVISIPCEAQKTISGSSESKNFQMQANYERGLPPNLYADLQFSDENGDSILDANEKAEIKLTLINKGKGFAQGLKISVTDESGYDSDLTIGAEKDIYFLPPEKSMEITIPISAGAKVVSGEHKLKIAVSEFFGYDMDPAYLVLNTLEFQPPKIAFSGYEVVDYGEGTAAINQDGQIQPGEMVKIKIYIQNIGQNVANELNYSVFSIDPNVFVDGKNGTLPDLAIGEVRSFWITVSPNKRVDPRKIVPLHLNVNVGNTDYGLENYTLELALNQRPPDTQILQVKANIEKLRQQVARFEISSNKFTANLGRLNNIREVPYAQTKRENAVAVVFGIEKYDNLPSAPYAENDANIIRDYFRDLLGINKVVVFTSSTARGLVFDDVFNPDYGELQKEIVPAQTDVFVFYSGHGMPSKSGDQVFLFPSDGKTARLDIQGYNLNKLYENLGKLRAKSVTVFIDACFSGSSRQSESIKTENLVSMKGIKIMPEIIQPWESDSTFSVMTSSSAEETSLALDASQTGLFTYFICTGLQGEADLNGDKSITLGELYAYLREKVTTTSVKISGTQTPEFHGNPNTILVQF